MLLDDYSGVFRPDFDLPLLSRQALAVLGREWLMHGHLQDRVGMPLVHQGRSREEMQEVAITEWMAASPIYSPRMQRAMGFAGSDVVTILKNLQFDIGAPHQFMDFRTKVLDANHAEFWLAHCGALMDVEPMGEEYVHGMCHTIEDPTFDATAVVANPRAQIRPIHRPPRTPADRTPHCHWTVTIDDAHPPVGHHPNVALLESTRIATVDIAVPEEDGEPGGWADYSGEYDPEFELEDLSHRALVIALQEFAVQSHLLFRSYLLAVSQAYGEDDARRVAPGVFTGLAGLTAQRLRPAMGIGGTDAEALAKLLQVHPVFWPRTYVDARVDILDDRRVHLTIGDCPALSESDGFTWFAQLPGDADRALGAIAWAVDPTATCSVGTGRSGAIDVDFVLGAADAPAREAREVALAKFSSGAEFVLTPRRPVRN